MEWTKEQRQAIDLRNQNILVAAAAGSGKTTVLVERIKNLIIKDKVDIDRMLVVTFTKAAATEMREKIIKAINKEIEEGEDKGIDTSFLRKQIDIIHRAQISTFHSFGEQVIKENFHVIGLEPSLTICDETDSTLLKQKALEKLLEKKYQESSPEFLDFIDAYGYERNDGKVSQLIIDGYEKLMSLPYPWKWLEERTEELKKPSEDSAIFQGVMEYCRGEMAKAAKTASGAVTFLEEEGLPGLAEKINVEVASFLEANALINQDKISFDKMGEALSLFKGVTLRPSTDEKEIFDGQVKAILDAKRKVYKDAVKNLKAKFFTNTFDEHVEDLQALHERFQIFGQLLRDFNEAYKAEKDRKKAIDFSDIEHYCLEILEDPKIAQIYRDRFQHIFVDEYQDSNLVQEEIISKVARENNRFLVGDVKQSIYKFRLAEPEIFHRTYQEFKDPANTNSIKIDLNTNYRSKSNVIATVNTFFEELMDEYDDAAALHQGDTYAGDLDYPTSLHVLDIGQELDDLDDPVRDMEKAQKEALLVTKYVEEIVGKKDIYDSKEGVVRKIQKKDVVILLRGARNKAQYYYQALMDHNIPAYVSGDEGYFGTIEVDAVVNLLQVISNKQQDIPLLAVLHSETFNFSLEELMDIRIQFRRGTFAKALMRYMKEGEDQKLREKCQAALKQIQEWRKMSGSLPLDQFVWKVINESGIYLTMGAFPGGVQRQANLRELVDKALAYQEKNVPTLNGFVEFIQVLREKKIQVGQVKLVGENDDLVRIMTIHKSKGLEFPVVIVADLGRGKNNKSDPVSFHKKLGIALPLVNTKEHWKKNTILENIINAQNAKEALEEEIRVLYVALTRAKDQLVLVGSHKDMEAYKEKIAMGQSSESSYLEMIGPVAYRSPLIHMDYNRSEELQKHIFVRKRKLENILSLFHEENHIADEKLAKMVAERVNFAYPYQRALDLKQKYSVSELNQMDAVKAPIDTGKTKMDAPHLTVAREVTLLQDEGELSAAEKGTLFHKIMEHLDFAKMGQDAERNRKTIEDSVQSMVSRGLLVQKELDQVDMSDLDRFFESQIGKRAVEAAKAGLLQKETPFTYQMELSGEKVLVQGIIDVYFEEDGKIVLMDYKTNYINPSKDAEKEKNRIKELYKTQMDIYQKALAAGLGKEVKESYLYLKGIGEFVKMN